MFAFVSEEDLKVLSSLTLYKYIVKKTVKGICLQQQKQIYLFKHKDDPLFASFFLFLSINVFFRVYDMVNVPMLYYTKLLKTNIL